MAGTSAWPRSSCLALSHRPRAARLPDEQRGNAKALVRAVEADRHCERMTNIPTAGCEAVNVILDAVAAHAIEEPNNLATMNLALARLADVEDAYRVTLNDEDEVSLDLSNLVGGAMVPISRLVQLVSDGQGVSRDEVISGLREWLG